MFVYIKKKSKDTKRRRKGGKEKGNGTSKNCQEINRRKVDQLLDWSLAVDSSEVTQNSQPSHIKVVVNFGRYEKIAV